MKVNLKTIFVIAYCFVLIILYADSTFLSDKKKMVYQRYVPENKEIGYDFTICYRFAEKLFVQKQILSINSPSLKPEYTVGFPPVFFYMLYPLFAFGLTAYQGFRIIYLLTLGSFFLIGLILPLVNEKRTSIPGIVGMLIITGLMSYGMQFEIERGQFNLITASLAILSVFIFWRFPKIRWLAYIFITISIQFKLYPLVFLVMFIENWRDWRKNVLRLGGLIAINFGLFFSMGYFTFVKFVNSLGNQLSAKGYVRDHSIHNFVEFLPKALNTTFSPQIMVTIKVFFYVIVTGIFLWLLYRYFKNDSRGSFNPVILMACIMLILLAVPTSKDYRLSVLIGGVVFYSLYLIRSENQLSGSGRIIYLFLCLLFYSSYSVILISFAYRPGLLQNSFPFLLVMMICLPAFEWVRSKTVERETLSRQTNT